MYEKLAELGNESSRHATYHKARLVVSRISPSARETILKEYFDRLLRPLFHQEKLRNWKRASFAVRPALDNWSSIFSLGLVGSFLFESNGRGSRVLAIGGCFGQLTKISDQLFRNLVSLPQLPLVYCFQPRARNAS